MRGGQNLINIQGQRFGFLLVLERRGSNKNRKALWKCRCDCGNTTIVEGKSLSSKNTRSCGCLRKKGGNRKHGLRYHPIYSVWRNIKQRCSNKNRPDYRYYGGRGIKVCDRWKKFENFYSDMISTYQKGLKIDRTNNDGNYEPENCRWVNHSEQIKNRNGFGSSKHKNINFHKASGKWQARKFIDGKRVHLGVFDSEEEAAEAINNA